MSLHAVAKAEPLPRHHARITFRDGFAREIDLRPALRGPAFAPLLDEVLFGQMRVEFDTIAWPNGVDISPETLRFWCERGSVTTEDEAETYFAAEPAARVAAQ